MSDRRIPATGNGMKTGHDTWLAIEHGDGNLDGIEPEVHLAIEGCCGDFAQAWFRVADLRAALDDEGSADLGT